MRRLEEFVNEKLKVTKGNVPPDIPLGKQGWICTSANSIYNDIRLIDNFLKTDIDLERLEYIDTEEYKGLIHFMSDRYGVIESQEHVDLDFK